MKRREEKIRMGKERGRRVEIGKDERKMGGGWFEDWGIEEMRERMRRQERKRRGMEEREEYSIR
jgi:hypothetical protein